jgi:hypothetical protein
MEGVAMSSLARMALCFVQLAIWLIPLGALQAQDRPKRFSIWDIHIGDVASDIPNEFDAYACGTNGGPPSVPLASFAEFKKCKQDANGLREVYFEYDDELEYWARALDLKAEIRMYSGTTAYEFPIVASVLFDEAGRVRGERMVTDPRQHTSRRRIEFWTLANFLRHRYGEDGWDCRDLPPDEGERPVGSLFIKNRCEKTADSLHFALEQRYFQKKGQQFLDSHTGKPQTEAYESVTRFEIYDAAVPFRKTSVN